MPKPVIELSISRDKIAKEHCFNGKNGLVVDCALFENRDGKDQYGNDGFVSQKVKKEARERGEKGPIIGNWKWVEKPAAAPQGKREYNLPKNTPDQRPKPPVDPDLDPNEPDDLGF